MADSWFHNPEYQNYWNYMSKVQKQAEEQVKINEQNSAAHWRSIALGLHYENQMLHQLVQQLLGTNIQQNVHEQNLDNSPISRERKLRRHKKSRKIASEVELSDSEKQINNSVIENHSVDSLEEYLRFVQETENHRERRDKNGKDESKQQKKYSPAEEIITDDILDRADDISTDFELLKKEMTDLYGQDAQKVHSLETRVQLEFDTWSDKHRPQLWPAMPLNMRR